MKIDALEQLITSGKFEGTEKIGEVVFTLKTLGSEVITSIDKKAAIESAGVNAVFFQLRSVYILSKSVIKVNEEDVEEVYITATLLKMAPQMIAKLYKKYVSLTGEIDNLLSDPEDVGKKIKDL